MKHRLTRRLLALFCAGALSFVLPASANLFLAEDIQTVSAVNHPPVAEALTLTTYKNVEVQGTFAGVDPEGDLLTFHQQARQGRRDPSRGGIRRLHLHSL